VVEKHPYTGLVTKGEDFSRKLGPGVRKRPGEKALQTKKRRPNLTWHLHKTGQVGERE